MGFSENLKFLRKTKDIGQSDVAKHLNISIKTVSHWETGYTEPSIMQLIALADFFDVSLDELLDRNQNK